MTPNQNVTMKACRPQQHQPKCYHGRSLSSNPQRSSTGAKYYHTPSSPLILQRHNTETKCHYACPPICMSCSVVTHREKCHYNHSPFIASSNAVAPSKMLPRPSIIHCLCHTAAPQQKCHRITSSISSCQNHCRFVVLMSSFFAMRRSRSTHSANSFVHCCRRRLKKEKYDEPP